MDNNLTLSSASLSYGQTYTSASFRMLDKGLDQMAETGAAIVDMMNDMQVAPVSRAQATGQGLHVNLAV